MQACAHTAHKHTQAQQTARKSSLTSGNIKLNLYLAKVAKVFLNLNLSHGMTLE